MAGEPIIVHVTPPPSIVVPVDVVPSPVRTPYVVEVGNFNTTPVAYGHTQNVASADWVIPHHLGYNPNVTVVNSAGTIVEGEITYTNLRTLTAHFTESFTGKAYLS
jgi:hypothetical protein